MRKVDKQSFLYLGKQVVKSIRPDKNYRSQWERGKGWAMMLFTISIISEQTEIGVHNDEKEEKTEKEGKEWIILWHPLQQEETLMEELERKKERKKEFRCRSPQAERKREREELTFPLTRSTRERRGVFSELERSLFLFFFSERSIETFCLKNALLLLFLKKKKAERSGAWSSCCSSLLFLLQLFWLELNEP